MEKITWKKFFNNVRVDDRVLLINPPIYDLRYNWLKWNQPMDLLMVSSFLKEECCCQVELFDFMLPRETGRVSTRTSEGNLDSQFQFIRYGRDLDEFKKILEGSISEWKPTKVIITSLTSYWFKGLIDVCLRIRNTQSIRDVEIYFIGNYPRYESNHFANAFANYIITETFNVTKCKIDFDLYFSDLSLKVHANKPFFTALHPNSDDIVSLIESSYKRNIRDFAFFSENVLKDKDHFKEVLKEIKKLKNNYNIEAKFHGICGFFPSNFEPDLLKMLIDAGFTELHLEYDCYEDGSLNLDAYREFRKEMELNHIEFASGFLSGFVNFGIRGEKLEQVLLHSLNILELFGAYIPKPFTAVPGSTEYKQLRRTIQDKDLQNLSPHCYPFAEDNGITVEEYQNYLRLSAFLNAKVRGKGFDFFDDSEVTKAIKGAFEREVWNIG